MLFTICHFNNKKLRRKKTLLKYIIEVENVIHLTLIYEDGNGPLHFSCELLIWSQDQTLSASGFKMVLTLGLIFFNIFYFFFLIFIWGGCGVFEAIIKRDLVVWTQNLRCVYLLVKSIYMHLNNKSITRQKAHARNRK